MSIGECGLRWNQNQEDHDRPYRPNDDGFNTGHAGPPARHIRMLRSVNSYEEVRDSNRPKRPAYSTACLALE